MQREHIVYGMEPSLDGPWFQGHRKIGSEKTDGFPEGTKLSYGPYSVSGPHVVLLVSRGPAVTVSVYG